jgi:hypothetical protein
VERAFGALENRFRILVNKPFHPYKTQVKLVLDCCKLHNWILRHGDEDYILDEATWTPNIIDNATQPDHVPDNEAWAQQREAWAAQMWQNRGSFRVLDHVFFIHLCYLF